MMSQAQRRFGHLLVDANLITIDDLAAHSNAAEAQGVPVAARLVATGQVLRSDALRIAAEELDVEFFDPEDAWEPDSAALQRLDASTAVSETALPIRVDHGVLVLAVPNPLDLRSKERLERSTRSEVELALGPRDALDETVRRLYMGPGAGTLAAVSVAQAPEPPSGFDASSEAEYHLNDLLDIMLDRGGSDLHLTSGVPPKIRVNGTLIEVEGYEMLRPAELRAMIYGILTARQKEQLEDELELDASHPVPGRGRFRVNVFFQRG